VTNEEAHRLARDKGVSRPLYALVKAIVVPFFRVWFRLSASGAEHVPREGAAVIAPNHKSFWDAFFVGACVKRHLRFMAKTELIEARYGRLLVRLGAFPVRRGEQDADALETARSVLRQGGMLVLFPEGTRIRDPEELGSPRRGAGRLALETGAPLVPAAIDGTDSLFLGPVPKPRRVSVAFAAPIPVHEMTATPEEATTLVRDMLWPEVETEFRRLRTRPTVVAAALAALGVGGGLVARREIRRRRRRSRLPEWIRRR
jgi:1-acyl-sn-glycerol-3-phosphate acyltransferase